MKLTEKQMVCIIRNRLLEFLDAEAKWQVFCFAEIELQWGEAGQLIVSPACISRLEHVYG